MNDQLAALVPEAQPILQRALRERWTSAFFELIVARLLQHLGASIIVELPTVSGRSPDYQAEFVDGTITVEATAPIFNASVGDQMKARRPLIEYIESVVPNGWTANVLDVPNIGLSDSQREFRRTVVEIMQSLPLANTAEPQRRSVEMASGTLELWLIPKQYDQKVGVEPPVAYIDNSESRIRRAVGRKRSQVRSADTRVVLAIHASGLSSSFEDFDQALFGRTSMILNEHRQVAGTNFMADGEFAKNRQGVPTYAAVLAFGSLGFTGGPDPVLYLHPRFTGQLPQALLSLEQRTYDGDTRTIKVQPSRQAGLLEALGFVKEVPMEPQD